MPWVARKVITNGTSLGLQMLSLLWFLFIFNILLEVDSLRWIYLASTSWTVDTACAIRRDRRVARESVSVHHVCSKGLHVVSVVELSLVVTIIYLDRLSIIQIILQSNQRSLTFLQENSKRRKKIERFLCLRLQIALKLIAIIEIYNRFFCDEAWWRSFRVFLHDLGLLFLNSFSSNCLPCIALLFIRFWRIMSIWFMILLFWRHLFIMRYIHEVRLAIRVGKTMTMAIVQIDLLNVFIGFFDCLNSNSTHCWALCCPQ